MRIMNDDKVVAHATYNSSGIPIYVEAEDTASKHDLPYSLFNPFADVRRVPYDEFLYWVKQRCFPENRQNKERLLADLGLSEYDALEIVYRTNARMHVDSFWVDWETE